MILVTGGAGYIGSHTVKALGEAGFRLVVFDDFSTGHRDFVRGVDVIEGNLGTMTDVQSVFDRYAIEGVVLLVVQITQCFCDTDLFGIGAHPGVFFPQG